MQLFYSTFHTYDSAVEYDVKNAYIHICTRGRVEEAICVYSAGHVT